MTSRTTGAGEQISTERLREIISHLEELARWQDMNSPAKAKACRDAIALLAYRNQRPERSACRCEWPSNGIGGRTWVCDVCRAPRSETASERDAGKCGTCNGAKTIEGNDQQEGWCPACGGTGQIQDVVDSVDPEWSQGVEYPCPDCSPGLRREEGKDERYFTDAELLEWLECARPGTRGYDVNYITTMRDGHSKHDELVRVLRSALSAAPGNGEMVAALLKDADTLIEEWVGILQANGLRHSAIDGDAWRARFAALSPGLRREEGKGERQTLEIAQHENLEIIRGLEDMLILDEIDLKAIRRAIAALSTARERTT